MLISACLRGGMAIRDCSYHYCPDLTLPSSSISNLNSQICNRLFARFLVLLIIIHYVRDMTADGEGLLVGARGFEADSDWGSLPDGYGAG